MDIREFMVEVERRFGNYERPAVRLLVTEYLAKTCSESEFEDLLDSLVLAYPPGFAPDIAMIEMVRSHKTRAQRHMASVFWMHPEGLN